MREFVVIAEFETDERSADVLIEAGLLEAEAALRDEDGCRAFDILVNGDNGRKGLFYEVYADEAAFLKHRQTAHYATFFAAIESLSVSWKKSRFWRLGA